MDNLRNEYLEETPEPDDFLVLPCPHCAVLIEIVISDINCGIFRHFKYKTGADFNPHASREECEKAIKEEVGYGCAGPFRIIGGEDEGSKWKLEVCGYI